MFLSVAIILALAASVAFNVWLVMRGRKPEAKKSVISIIQTKMRDSSEMVTLRAFFQGIASDSETGKKLLGVKIPETGRKFIAVYSGEIICGCDMANIDISERFDVNRVIVKIPHSTIMNINVNPDDIKVYHQDKGFFAQAYKLDDQNAVIASSIKAMREKAINEWDLLTRSDENAKRNLTAFINSLGMEAEVIFTDADNADNADVKLNNEEIADLNNLSIANLDVKIPETVSDLIK